MPRIDPFQLLKCLSVLLGPTGGIKSKEEVHRLANLMTKFSKKLVSKCIYIQILKTTNTELLSQFMDAGGWSLVHMWLTDGIVAKNWALIQELLELLHLCPVKIERLKSNNCPKLIKGLSKEVSHQGVRLLASRLVEQWLKIVKGEAAPNSVPAQIIGSMTLPTSNFTEQTERYTITDETNSANDETSETTTVKVQDLEQTSNNYTIETNQSFSQPMQLHILNPPTMTTAQSQQVQHITKQSYVVVGNGTSVVPSGPVCKITIRDGNHVLVKVETDAANINNAINTSHEMNGELAEIETTSDQHNNDADYDEMTVERLEDEDYDGTTVDELTSEVKQTSVVCTKNNENHQISGSTSVKSKESKDREIVIGDGSKSSDKENRDSHKCDDKKLAISSTSSSSNSGDKKSSGSSSKSSSNSSKHSSSSHRTSSHRSSHRSASSSSSSTRTSSSKDRSSRDKDRHRHTSSTSKHGSSSTSSTSNKSNKTERDKERDKEKEKLKKDQADKDKATLEKVQAQAISSKLGKIPRKKPDDDKQVTTSESLLRKSSTDSKDSSKENKDKAEIKKSAVMGNLAVLEKKNISMSIENRKNTIDSTRPKTVKTFNSKFRSTGLEEEVKPPPPRSAAKKTAIGILDKKIVPAKPLTSLKRASPLRETSVPSDKRAKLSLDPPNEPIEEKKGAIKLISPKPKPMVLQESDMFMDALMTASTKSKEPRKRNKRRTSLSKDGTSDSKKSDLTNSDGGHDSPSQNPSSPQSADDRSPLALKPNFKFYQDTLETDEDKEEKEELVKKMKEEESEEMKLDADGNEDYETSVSNLVKTEMAAMAVKAEAKDSPLTARNVKAESEDTEETKFAILPETDETIADVKDFIKKDRSLSPQPEIRYVDGLRSVLLLQKRKGPKKCLRWKTDLECIRYFELDETERVNVTKTFTDMKQEETQNEREAFQMARKLSTEDTMEEKTVWKLLIPVDLMAPLAEPGKDSREKGIQYAREKGILQALYFNRSMIPDSPAEPDEERHHIMTDPKIIPLEDLTGNKDSEKDFTGVAWPEPKPSLPPPPPGPIIQPPGYHFPPVYPHSQPPMMPPMGPPGPMGQMPPMPPGPMMGPMNHMGPPPDMGGGGPMGGPPGGGGGGWRTGDGKVIVPDVGMNPMQQPMPNMPGGYPPGMDGPPMGPPGMMGPPMYNQQDGYGMMGPDDMGYGNYQGPPGPPGMYGPGPNFPGGPPRGGGPMHNRGRGAGPGWFRGGGVGGGPMGPRMGGGGGGWRGGWRGNGKQPPICRQFTKNGFCRVGDKCQYLHPGVNCPPF